MLANKKKVSLMKHAILSLVSVISAVTPSSSYAKSLGEGYSCTSGKLTKNNRKVNSAAAAASIDKQITKLQAQLAKAKAKKESKAQLAVISSAIKADQKLMKAVQACNKGGGIDPIWAKLSGSFTGAYTDTLSKPHNSLPLNLIAAFVSPRIEIETGPLGFIGGDCGDIHVTSTNVGGLTFPTTLSISEGGANFFVTLNNNGAISFGSTGLQGGQVARCEFDGQLTGKTFSGTYSVVLADGSTFSSGTFLMNKN
jgi:hypothetical protein